MARMVSTVLVVALLAATATAFALTEGLKLQPAPISAVSIPRKVLSPVCGCRTESAPISFRLREPDVLDVTAVDADDRVVATIVRGRRFPAGRVQLEFTGRDEDGLVLPEGEYRPRVHLRRERTTIVMPNPISVDVTPPVVEEWDVRPRVFSPDGDGRADRVTVRYRLSEEARGLLYVNGVRRGETRLRRPDNELPWFGRADGRPLPPGRYDLTLSARDQAGNLARRTSPIPVRIRYVALGRDRIEVAAGARFAVRVSSDARVVRWQLGRRSGESAPGTLVVRAPAQKGRYTLVVTANGYAARAAVFVRESRP